MSAFEKIVSDCPAPLVEAALELATDAYPDLDIPLYLEQIQQLAEGFDIFLATRLEGDFQEEKILEQLNDFFFHELGFAGNTCDYYDVRNSYINEVLDRRVGIPISLSVVYQALAASAGVRLFGINFPGHFLLAFLKPNGQRLYIDVFQRGRMFEWSECDRRLREQLGLDCRLEESEFPPMSNRDILVRMLRNLKGIYSRHNLDLCLRVQERIVKLMPHDPSESRDLGALYFHSGHPMMAVKTFEKVLRQHPYWAEKNSVESYLSQAVREAVLLN
ncbi:MAG: transglutaminase-like domain-containing protein [Planctomycetota bacterium]